MQLADFLGYAECPPDLRQQLWALPPFPPATRHCLLSGPERSGKTSLLFHTALVAARQGKEVLLLCRRCGGSYHSSWPLGGSSLVAPARHVAPAHLLAPAAPQAEAGADAAAAAGRRRHLGRCLAASEHQVPVQRWAGLPIHGSPCPRATARVQPDLAARALTTAATPRRHTSCCFPPPPCLATGTDLLRYVSLIHALPAGPPDLLLVDDLHALADLPAGDRSRPRDMALCRILASLHEAAVRRPRLPQRLPGLLSLFAACTQGGG